MRRLSVWLGLGAIVILGGCSGQPSSASKATAKPPEPVSGQTALYRMYQVARTWSPDVQVLRMTSIDLNDVPEVRGKAGAWRATFTSEAKSAARTYTYSVEETEPNLHLGAFALQPESWSPSPDAQPFVIAAVKVDTDAAYKKALEVAGELAAKQKAPTISFVLDKQRKFPDASWRVVWGESVGTSGLSVFVDASTGEYLETMH